MASSALPICAPRSAGADIAKPSASIDGPIRPSIRAGVGVGIGIVNGVFGDHLAREHNPLAIRLGFRDGSGRPLRVSESAGDAAAEAPSDLAIFIHGLCCDERIWWRYATTHWPGEAEPQTYASRLHREHGWTPLFLRYNSGRRIADNGVEAASALESLIARWRNDENYHETDQGPRPPRIALIGHSMGGLVALSAAHHALCSGMAWTERVTQLVCLGSPHHGAPLEKFGQGVTTLLGAFAITRPLAVAIDSRSAGIRDLRHGLLQPDATAALDHDPAAPIRFLPNARHHFIGATLGTTPQSIRSRLFGDGLVPATSAGGQHRDPARRLPFAEGDGLILSRLHHLQLVNHPEVYAHLARWLAPAPVG